MITGANEPLVSVSEADGLIARCTGISRAELVLVSELKKVLAGDIPANYRLKFLQWLEGRTNPAGNGWNQLRSTQRLSRCVATVTSF
jgi:hypothetical protein